MSYILDALKKLEQEKIRKSKMPGSITIAGELFCEKSPVRRGNNGRIAAVAILVAVGITFSLTWYFLKGRGKNILAQNVTQTVVKPVVATPSTVIPVIPNPAPLQPSQVPVPLVTPVIQHSLAVKQQPNYSVATDDDEQQPAASRLKISNQVLMSKYKANVVSNGKKTSQPLAPAPSDIQVNGVAWQDERGLRRAVVNGLLLKEGSTISGAQLKEILPDRVRFERSGSVFEVQFVSSKTLIGK